jgi:fucose 4-O-acetylase-like acetyltransferase
MKHFLQVQWNIPVPLAGAWGAAGEVLLPLRMPLFFAISGFFAAGALARPWRVVGRSKVAKFFYLYALWLLIHTAVFSFVPEDFDTARAGSFGELLAQLTISPTNLWYLYALALYFVLAKVLRPVPPLVMLAVAFVVSAAASAELIPTPGDRKDLFENLLFFLAGAYGKSYLARVATAANWPRFFAVAVPYVGILAVTYYLGADTWFGLMPTISFVAVFLGVTAASLITRWEALANGLVSLGRRTLYVDGTRSFWQRRARKQLFAWARASSGRRLMISEGQAEPWEAVTTPPNPSGRSMYSCRPEHLIENYNRWMRWTRGAGLALDAYLFWGAEYWMLRQQSGDSSYIRSFERILEQA